jgi:hypothetical protein
MRVFHEFVKAAHFEACPVPIEQDELSLWFNYKAIKLRILASLQPFLRLKLGTMNIRHPTLFPDLEGGFVSNYRTFADRRTVMKNPAQAWGLQETRM